MRMNGLIVVVVVVAMTAALVAEAQDIPPCASNLVACAEYLNTTTTPPETCCGPLKQAIATQLPCLCSIFSDPSFLKSLGINITQVIELPARCNISFSITECTGSPAPNSPIPPPSASVTPSSKSPWIAPSGKSWTNSPWIAPSGPSTSDVSRIVSGALSCLSIFVAAMVCWVRL